MNWGKEALEEIAHGRAAAMRIGGISDLPLIGSVQPRAAMSNTNVNPPVGAGQRRGEAEQHEEYEDVEPEGTSGVGAASSGTVPSGLEELSKEDYYAGGDDEDDQVEMVAV